MGEIAMFVAILRLLATFFAVIAIVYTLWPKTEFIRSRDAVARD